MLYPANSNHTTRHSVITARTFQLPFQEQWKAILNIPFHWRPTPLLDRVLILRKGQLNRHTRYRPATTARNTATQRSRHSETRWTNTPVRIFKDPAPTPTSRSPLRHRQRCAAKLASSHWPVHTPRSAFAHGPRAPASFRLPNCTRRFSPSIRVDGRLSEALAALGGHAPIFL